MHAFHGLTQWNFFFAILKYLGIVFRGCFESPNLVVVAFQSRLTCYRIRVKGFYTMSKQLDDRGFHLPDLSIKGFRCFDKLSIPKLGHVTLFTGRNGCGKTTILEAVKVYAARADESVLAELIIGREEFLAGIDKDGEKVDLLDFKALFHGREPSTGAQIEIGSEGKTGKLKIKLTAPDDKSLSRFRELVADDFPGRDVPVFRTTFRGKKWLILGSFENNWRMKRRIQHVIDRDEKPATMKSQWLGPQILSNRAIAELWDEVTLTEDEDLAINALNLVLDDPVDRVAMIGEEGVRARWRGRRAVVRLGKHGPVSLKSLGDGATRLFSTALAMGNCRNGFLLIDEAENGIHYTAQHKFWSMILRTAQENNIQVFATTHSFDCVRGFARAATEAEDVSGVLIRLEREEGRTRCIRYSENELESATEYNIEVR